MHYGYRYLTQEKKIFFFFLQFQLNSQKSSLYLLNSATADDIHNLIYAEIINDWY